MRALLARKREGLTSRDSLHDTPCRDLHAGLVRSARRLRRVDQLTAPPELLERELALARKSAALARRVDSGRRAAPSDVAAVVSGLGA